MYLGNIVEVADTDELYENPKHPYTRALLESIPVPNPRSTDVRTPIEGEVPSPIDPPSGCRFRTRCPELIAPAELELSGDEWANVRKFMRAVERKTFATENADELRARFFDGTIPTGDVRDIVEEAIALVEEDRRDEAGDLLLAEIADASVCATETPAYDVEAEHGDDRHFVACHLHRE
jgi:peptide/nickel transport system ATP-binding protein